MNLDAKPTTLESEGSKNAKSGGEILQFATFYLNGELLGLNILQVQEIQMPQHVTPVPLAPPHIIGLISLRGQIVTLIDLRTRLGMDTGEPIEYPNHIVVNTGQTIACFEVGDVGDVIDVPQDEFVPPPESVRLLDAKFLEGVFPLEHEILTVLNVDTVLETG